MNNDRAPKPALPARNVRSHSGVKVHTGRWQYVTARRAWFEVPACGVRPDSIAFGYPTDDAVTCGKPGCRRG